MELSEAIDIIFLKCFDLKKDESVLIVHDSHYANMTNDFVDSAKTITTNKIDYIEIPEGQVNGEEPPAFCARRMLEYDVIVLLVKKSLSHTEARKKASENGARIASMPSVTDEMLERCIDIDYSEMNELSNKICDLIDSGKTIRLVKDDGTDFSFSIDGREGHGRHGGVFVNKGEWGNLPDGEAFVAPLEGTANGKYIIDGSVAREGIVDQPISVVVKEGKACTIEGGAVADALHKTLEEVGEKAFNIAEFGIGVNPKAIITGNMLEDEKVKGTVHIAFGNNFGFGGNVHVPLHIDCLIKKPTFYIDEKLVMKGGEFQDF